MTTSYAPGNQAPTTTPGSAAPAAASSSPAGSGTDTVQQVSAAMLPSVVSIVATTPAGVDEGSGVTCPRTG